VSLVGDIRLTNDGGYVVVSTIADIKAWVVKLDESGNLMWQRSYRFSGSGRDYGRAIRPTEDGGYIVAGDTGATGINEVWVFKLDEDGDIQWQNVYRGSGAGSAAEDITLTDDDGYMVVGYTTIGAPRFWLLRLAANGSIVWQKAYGGDSPVGEQPFATQTTADGGFIVAGSTVSFGAGDHDLWLLRLDGDGMVVWQKAYGGPGGERAHAVELTSDGGYVVAGWTSTWGLGFRSAWLLKLDGTGSILWERTYGDNNGAQANDVEETSDGGYIIAGYDWILKVDGNGGIDKCRLAGESSANVENTVTTVLTTTAYVETSAPQISMPTLSAQNETLQTLYLCPSYPAYLPLTPRY
jgi:hypothetical protein